jgi:microcystin-dependent protein
LSLAPAAVGSVGSSLPHDNMIPYLPINFIISLAGIYPSQN